MSAVPIVERRGRFRRAEDAPPVTRLRRLADRDDGMVALATALASRLGLPPYEIPRVAAALRDEIGAGERAASAGSSVPARPAILVVEDDDGLRMALEEGLAAHGFEPHAVGDAESAYRCVARVAPDLILLDWVLPGGGGAYACRRLLDLHPPARVVVFTGLSDLRDRRAAREAGAADFLQKGLPLDVLADRLRQIAGG